MSSFDSLTLEILWSRLISLVDEMAVTMLRTSFSTVIGAANDFGCELLDSRGRGLAHATRSMPVFNQTLPHVTKHFIEKYGEDGIRPGDIYITNDPWLCAGHQPDIAVILPFFRNGKRVGFAGSIGHMADIGGALDSNAVHEVYEEGLFIPPTRLYAEGKLVDAVLDFVRANVRVPDMVIGDIHAQVSAAQVGAARALALLDEYNLDGLDGIADEIHARSEAAMRDAIRAVPDGTYTCALTFDELDGPLPLQVAVKVNGDEITVDYTGSAPQHPRGGINCTLTYTLAHTAYSLKCALLPEVPSNSGCYQPIRVIAPAGSVLNCKPPSSVTNRTRTGWYIAPLIFGALSRVIPDRVMASGGLMTGYKVYGIAQDDSTFNAWLFNSGGLGGNAHGDGASATIFPSSASNVPVELFEVAVPVLVHEKELVPDSGGAGKHRGGLGQRVTISRLVNYVGKLFVMLWPHRQVVPPEGLVGGAPGKRTRIVWNRKELSREEITSNTGVIALDDAHEMVSIETAGGGGFGSPGERARELIERDARDELVTRVLANEEYGA
ncbi:MAG: hydantoinase B/oxoprolinase family protein [Chloroflexi bacterium]|nr:hydantoinase B/oxoprolinase family protein [Chloroflexota bacterium]